MARPLLWSIVIKASGEKDIKSLSAAFGKATTMADKMEAQFKDASAAAKAAGAKMADATGRVRVAEAKLQELRESGKAKASQLKNAEESLERARRAESAALEKQADATAKLSDAERAAHSKTVALKDAFSALRTQTVKSDGVLHKIGTTAAGVFAGLSVSALASKGVDFVKESVHQAVEGESAQAALQQAIKNTGKSYAGIAPHIESVTKRMADLGFEDDAVKQALATMTTALKDPAKALSMLDKAADLQRFQQARGNMMSLSDAGLIMAKILNGQGNKAVKGLGLNLAVTGSSAAQVAKLQQKATAAHKEYLAVLGKSATVTTRTRGNDNAVARARLVLDQATAKLNRSAAKTPALQDAVARAAQRLAQAEAKGTSATVKHGASADSAARALAKWKAAQSELAAAQGSGAKMMEGVTKAIGGQAEAFTKTAAGGLAKYEATMKNVKEELGRALLPELLKLSGWFTKTGAPALEAFAAGFSGKDGIRGQMTDTQKTAHDFGEGVKNAFTVAKDTVGAFVSFLADHKDEVETFAKVAGSIWAGVKAFQAVSAITTGIFLVVNAFRALAVSGAEAGIGEAAATGGASAIPAIAGMAAIATTLVSYGLLNKSDDKKAPPQGSTDAGQTMSGASVLIPNYFGQSTAGAQGRSAPSHRATGGPVTAGSTYLVGERGPEMLVMGSQSGMVIPNGASTGNVYNTVHITGVVDEAMVRKLRDMLAQLGRRNGGGTVAYGV